VHPRRSGAVSLLLAGTVLSLLTSAGIAQDKISAADAKNLKSPIPYTKTSIKQGRGTFARYCTGCHGGDGKSQVDVVADATDLTDPKGYRDGASEGEMYRSIRDGAGASMPAFKSQIQHQEDMWHLVNFIRSLWPDSMQPHLESDEKSK
jgi:mono/diheme cytochrome c family protein